MSYGINDGRNWSSVLPAGSGNAILNPLGRLVNPNDALAYTSRIGAESGFPHSMHAHMNRPDNGVYRQEFSDGAAELPMVIEMAILIEKARNPTALTQMVLPYLWTDNSRIEIRKMIGRPRLMGLHTAQGPWDVVGVMQQRSIAETTAHILGSNLDDTFRLTEKASIIDSMHVAILRESVNLTESVEQIRALVRSKSIYELWKDGLIRSDRMSEADANQRQLMLFGELTGVMARDLVQPSLSILISRANRALRMDTETMNDRVGFVVMSTNTLDVMAFETQKFEGGNVSDEFIRYLQEHTNVAPSVAMKVNPLTLPMLNDVAIIGIEPSISTAGSENLLLSSCQIAQFFWIDPNTDNSVMIVNYKTKTMTEVWQTGVGAATPALNINTVALPHRMVEAQNGARTGYLAILDSEVAERRELPLIVGFRVLRFAAETIIAGANPVGRTIIGRSTEGSFHQGELRMQHRVITIRMGVAITHPNRVIVIPCAQLADYRGGGNATPYSAKFGDLVTERYATPGNRFLHLFRPRANTYQFADNGYYAGDYNDRYCGAGNCDREGDVYLYAVPSTHTMDTLSAVIGAVLRGEDVYKPIDLPTLVGKSYAPPDPVDMAAYNGAANENAVAILPFMTANGDYRAACVLASTFMAAIDAEADMNAKSSVGAALLRDDNVANRKLNAWNLFTAAPANGAVRRYIPGIGDVEPAARRDNRVDAAPNKYSRYAYALYAWGKGDLQHEEYKNRVAMIKNANTICCGGRFEDMYFSSDEQYNWVPADRTLGRSMRGMQTFLRSTDPILEITNHGQRDNPTELAFATPVLVRKDGMDRYEERGGEFGPLEFSVTATDSWNHAAKIDYSKRRKPIDTIL